MLSNEYAGFETYKKYLAVKMHFTGSYDFFKYKAQVKAFPQSFRKRKDKFFFEKIERNYEDDEIIGLFVSNFIENENTWIRNIASDAGARIYRNWRASLNCIKYKFKEQLKLILDEDISKASLFQIRNGNHPPLIKLYMGGQIHLDTMVVFNIMFDFVSYFDRKLECDPIWEQIRNKILKYQPFAEKLSSIDKTEMREIFDNT